MTRKTIGQAIDLALDNKRKAGKKITSKLVLVTMLEALTDPIQAELMAGQYDRDEQSDLMVHLAKSLTYILVTCMLVEMPAGMEDKIPEKVEMVGEGMKGDLVHLIREMLALNGMADPWALSDTNRRTFHDIMDELRRRAH